MSKINANFRAGISADDPRASSGSTVPVRTEYYSSYNDDPETRVENKTIPYLKAIENLPAFQPATTKERATERSSNTENSRTISWYTRDFGDKTNPNFADVQQQAGIRIGTDTSDASSNPQPAASPDPHITSMNIMHNWTQQVRDEEFVATINIISKSAHTSVGPEGRIVWIHIRDPFPSFERLEKNFKDHLAPKLQPFVGDTTISLLKRVKSTRERKLKSGTLGRFLLSGITRYSARSSQTNNEDHPCLFLAFPYLCLGRFAREPADEPMDEPQRQSQTPGQDLSHNVENSVSHPDPDVNNAHRSGSLQNVFEMRKFSRSSLVKSMDSGKSSSHYRSYHSPRTLLQSRYRLESTKRRDRQQAIFALTTQQVRDCISRPSQSDVVRSPRYQPPQNESPQTPERPGLVLRGWSWLRRKKQKRDRLYIPQLWSLSLSGDVMLTCSPIGLDDLCGFDLLRKPFEGGQSQLRHSIVRFVLEHDNRNNDVFVYPAESCEWFFGLLNKQRKVESHVGAQYFGEPDISHNGAVNDVVDDTRTTRISPDGENSEGIPVVNSSSDRAPDQGASKSDSLRYDIIYRRGADDVGEIVNCNNWLRIQSEHPESTLDLFLESRDRRATASNESSMLTATWNTLQPGTSHVRSLSDTTDNISPAPPRLLLTPDIEEPRGRSGTSSVRSASPASVVPPIWPEKYDPFFAWEFLEEVGHDSRETSAIAETRRVHTWLAKVHNVLYRSHEQVLDDSLSPGKRTRWSGQPEKVKHPIQGTTHRLVKDNLFSHSATSGHISVVEREAAKIFSLARQLLGYFVPSEYVNPDGPLADTEKTILIYWGLLENILRGIISGKVGDNDRATLLQALSQVLDLAQHTHRGVWQMNDPKNNPRNIKRVSSAVIHQPLVEAFESLCDLYFHVVTHISRAGTLAPPQPAPFSQVINTRAEAILTRFRQAQRFLIQGADENRYQKSLGPVVTPEGITILLLRRLSRGVYRDGTVNIIEVYEKVIERLAIRVEQSASRFLLFEINHVAEEIDIILENLHDQRNFLISYRDYLDPEIIENPTIKRRARFEFERYGINRLIAEVEERIRDSQELREHVDRLSRQNLQLVEGGQDDINKKLMLFTLVTIIFLPLSFVTSFFGMNVEGIVNTDYDTTHFWIIAVPLTVGLLLASAAVLYSNALASRLTRVWTWVLSDKIEDD